MQKEKVNMNGSFALKRYRYHESFFSQKKTTFSESLRKFFKRVFVIYFFILFVFVYFFVFVCCFVLYFHAAQKYPLLYGNCSSCCALNALAECLKCTFRILFDYLLYCIHFVLYCILLCIQLFQT